MPEHYIFIQIIEVPTGKSFDNRGFVWIAEKIRERKNKLAE